MLWEIDIACRPGLPNRAAEAVAAAAIDLGLARPQLTALQGYLVQGPTSRNDVERIAHGLLADSVVETALVARVGDAALSEAPPGLSRLVHVLPKPGVMDPVAQSASEAISDLGIQVEAVRTLKKYWFAPIDDAALERLAAKVLANDAIEQVVVGPLTFDRLEIGQPYRFELKHVAIRELDDAALMKLSREGQLYLQLAEMQAIQAYYRDAKRDPTDAELETLAQTWSEHCSHKTLAGRIAYRGPLTADSAVGERRFENMLKETIFAATQQIRKNLGSKSISDDWCVSVFKDNAGVVRFDGDWNVCFKVETHNHPSALEPYGGSNTGVGGVIRDTLGTGLGAKPICNTDVFCFAEPNTPADSLPPGTLHPKRVMKGVVSGVRDYGNRMGIPTVNGAICFDRRYLGNPLVFCGNVGLIPHNKSFKQPQVGDHVVAIGGRTGRDGIHGATFSSAELTHESESLSGGAVQIGNAVTEKMVTDVVLQARDRGLFTAITDCGAGGFSSAVGEMGQDLGAEVWLERAPLKYEGLSYTEIWISEAQERMVLSVPPDKWEEFHALCAGEGVEATIIGRFGHADAAGKPCLELKYDGQVVAELDMQFLHDGRPPVVREATYSTPLPSSHTISPAPLPSREGPGEGSKFQPTSQHDHNATLLKILGSLNVASKEWVIRQYDHEVQGGSVVKPLTGINNDGPSDAAVVRPILSSRRGIVIGCGINPHYGDLDTWHMAASAIDEAVRNCVAVGADPARIAILDNFCWGDCEKAETLGSLVRAALACHDVALALGTPFISGKDSLNNEFSFVDAAGQKQSIAIPPTLLISALGQIDDVSRAVTMDLKKPGSLIYLVGSTKNELGGSHYALVHSLTGGSVPQVDPQQAKQTFAALHRAIQAGLVRACHDLSEGGLAVAAAEMAFAGGLGLELDLKRVAADSAHEEAVLLFAESNSRFLCEVATDDAAQFENMLSGVPHAGIGHVIETPRLTVVGASQQTVIDLSLVEMKSAWQAPLRW